MASGGPSREVKRAHSAMDQSHNIHENFFEILRNFTIVIFIAVLVWGFCSSIRYAISSSSKIFIFSVNESNSNAIWIVCGILLVGGVLRGLLLLLPSFKEAEGDGVAVAITNFHATYEDDADENVEPKRYKKPMLFESIRRGIMTVLTVGTGGSGGIEAPVLPIGEQVGSFWSKVFKIKSRDDLRAFQMAGIAAAVSTLLDAPFMAAIFAAEVLFTDRNIYRLMIYAMLGSVVAFVLNNHFLNFEPLFVVSDHDVLYSFWEYAQVSIVAILASAPSGFFVGWVLSKLRVYILLLPTLARPILGAFMTGTIALIMWFGFDVEPRHILGVGEETIKALLENDIQGPLSVWWILLLLVVAKTFATGFTLMSGGSAGLLVPAMFLGGASGAAIYQLLVSFGIPVGVDVNLYIVSGIAAALVAVIEVPISAVAFVMEVFGSHFGPPAIVSVVLCHMMLRKIKYY